VAARNAGDVLRGMRDFTTVPALSAYVIHPLDEESGASVARALGVIGHPTAVPALETALGSSLAGVRAQAAVALRTVRATGGAKTAARVAPLVALLHDGDAGVRRQAATTIGFIAQSKGDTTGALAALLPVVTDDSVAAVRKAAAWALGELHDGGARTALSRAASDSDPLVRSIASAALVNLR
jgi:HEAT repeat protein